MKKILAILMALCMFCGVAMAEAATELNWDEIAPIIEQSGIAGDFVTFDEMGLSIWIPSDLSSVEPSEEDVANGRYALYIDNDQECYLAVYVINVEGMTLDQFSRLLEKLGVQNAYNLDGGSSTWLVLDNKKINARSKKRSIADIVYFATAYSGEEQ